MDEDHERVVDCTTPNFTGQANHPPFSSFSIISTTIPSSNNYFSLFF
jgi:hypothetical protein